jgi:uncharacterized protein YjgD (DUF1641 family)
MPKLSKSQLSHIKEQVQKNKKPDDNKKSVPQKKQMRTIKKHVRNMKDQGLIKSNKQVLKINAEIGDLVTFKSGHGTLMGLIVDNHNGSDFYTVLTKSGPHKVYVKSIRKIT